jgi:hypothetical protein
VKFWTFLPNFKKIIFSTDFHRRLQSVQWKPSWFMRTGQTARYGEGLSSLLRDRTSKPLYPFGNIIFVWILSSNLCSVHRYGTTVSLMKVIPINIRIWESYTTKNGIQVSSAHTVTRLQVLLLRNWFSIPSSYTKHFVVQQSSDSLWCSIFRYNKKRSFIFP